jgi:hypothetical protein
MAQEKPWRPADYPPLAVYLPQQTVYVPPQTGANWGFADRHERSSAGRGGSELGRHQQSRRGLPYTAWNILAWAFTCGLVAGIVAMVVAALALHLK